MATKKTATRPKPKSSATRTAKKATKAKPAAASAKRVASKAVTSVGTIAAAKRAGSKIKKSVAEREPDTEALSKADAVSKRVALACAEAALDKKAVNVVILDVRGKVDYADYLVVMSGRSDRQVQALARGIAEDVEQKTKTKCLSVEALPGSSWVLMDFGDVVVHVFYDDVRGYYDLESLWMDARRIPVPGAAPQA